MCVVEEVWREDQVVRKEGYLSNVLTQHAGSRASGAGWELSCAVTEIEDGNPARRE